MRLLPPSFGAGFFIGSPREAAADSSSGDVSPPEDLETGSCLGEFAPGTAALVWAAVELPRSCAGVDLALWMAGFVGLEAGDADR